MGEDGNDTMRDRVRQGYEEADFPVTQPDNVEFSDAERRMVEAFIDRLPDNGHVVDMGCGSGVPYDRFLVDHGYEVTGVDIAATTIKAARERVPEAQYVQTDFTAFEPDRTFDGLLCMFALFHVPREEHAEALSRFRSMLMSGAPILLTMGTEDVEHMTQEFDGAQMEWSFYDADTNKELIEDAGFTIRQTDLIPDNRDGSEHLWVLAEADQRAVR